MKRHLTVSAYLVGLMLVVSIAGCAQGDVSDEEPPATPAPVASEGEKLVENKCSMCHTLDRVNEAEKNRAEWEQTVSRMEVNGMVVTEEEKSLIIDHLSTR